MKLSATGAEVDGESVANERLVETGVADSLDEQHGRVVGKEREVVSGLVKP
jgi:hypothetical protein